MLRSLRSRPFAVSAMRRGPSSFSARNDNNNTNKIRSTKVQLSQKHLQSNNHRTNHSYKQTATKTNSLFSSYSSPQATNFSHTSFASYLPPSSASNYCKNTQHRLNVIHTQRFQTDQARTDRIFLRGVTDKQASSTALITIPTAQASYITVENSLLPISKFDSVKDYTVPVVTFDNLVVGSFFLAPYIFSTPPRSDLIQRVVRWQLAKRRQGSASKLSRGEVEGGTRKIRPQKKTGSARAGSSRVNIWRHGGMAFPPKPRSFAFDVPTKIRRLALRVILASKFRQGKLVVLDSTRLETHRSKELQQKIDNFQWKTALIVDGPYVDKNLELASRNLQQLTVLPQRGFNVYDIMKADILCLTPSSIHFLETKYAADFVSHLPPQ